MQQRIKKTKNLMPLPFFEVNKFVKLNNNVVYYTNKICYNSLF
jgi:hypothetical protein